MKTVGMLWLLSGKGLREVLLLAKLIEELTQLVVESVEADMLSGKIKYE